MGSSLRRSVSSGLRVSSVDRDLSSVSARESIFGVGDLSVDDFEGEVDKACLKEKSEREIALCMHCVSKETSFFCRGRRNRKKDEPWSTSSVLAEVV